VCGTIFVANRPTCLSPCSRLIIPGHARELAATAAATGRPLIVAISGDGVYNEVVNGIMDVEGSSAVSAVAGRRERD